LGKQLSLLSSRKVFPRRFSPEQVGIRRKKRARASVSLLDKSKNLDAPGPSSGRFYGHEQ
jgi:hypothetical protein